MNELAFDWSDLAFGSKKPLRGLKATFVMAPREISAKRFTQIVKEWLPKGNIVLGIAKEEYVDGFDGQPQFRTLQPKTVQGIIDKVNASGSPHKIYTLRYFQREVTFIVEKLAFPRAVLVRGSWQHAFHLTPAYYALVNAGTKFDSISPFCDEAEARAYEVACDQEIAKASPFSNISTTRAYTAAEMMDLVAHAAKYSYDHTFQTGAILAKKTKNGYRYLHHSYNKVVPFQTYALLHGASREQHFSPANDLNHYDTNHAEVEMLIAATKRGLSLKDTSLFINLMPCPTCARMLSQTDIAEFVYQIDHSDSYALEMLHATNKMVHKSIKT